MSVLLFVEAWQNISEIASCRKQLSVELDRANASAKNSECVNINGFLFPVRQQNTVHLEAQTALCRHAVLFKRYFLSDII